MNLIGASLLTEYAGKRPEAAPILKALHALVREASWAGRSDIERQFAAIARFEGNAGVVLQMEDAGLRVAFNVDYQIGLVRIVSVSTMDAGGR